MLERTELIVVHCTKASIAKSTSDVDVDADVDADADVEAIGKKLTENHSLISGAVMENSTLAIKNLRLSSSGLKGVSSGGLVVICPLDDDEC